MAGFQISTYITGWAMPKGQMAEAWLRDWQVQHDKDHNNIYSALNSLNVALGNSEYEINKASLVFNPGDIKSINDFLQANKFQHNEFYQWLNQTGADLPKYNKAVITIQPMTNPSGPLLKFDESAWGNFAQSERAVHLMQLSAINQIYLAFGK